VVGGVLAGHLPRLLPSRGPGGGDSRERCRGIGGEVVDAAGHRWVGGHRPEHLRMRAQLGDVGHAHSDRISALLREQPITVRGDAISSRRQAC
jgi:hypothetical protein